MDEPPISKGMLVLLIMVSVLVDVVQFLIDLIPVAGWLISALIDFFAAAIFFGWFKLLGVKFTKGPLMSFIAGMVVDAIPYASIIGWTLDVILVSWTANTQWRSQYVKIEP